MKSKLPVYLFSLLSGMLSACGGGGGDGSPTNSGASGNSASSAASSSSQSSAATSSSASSASSTSSNTGSTITSDDWTKWGLNCPRNVSGLSPDNFACLAGTYSGVDQSNTTCSFTITDAHTSIPYLVGNTRYVLTLPGSAATGYMVSYAEVDTTSSYNGQLVSTIQASVGYGSNNSLGLNFNNSALNATIGNLATLKLALSDTTVMTSVCKLRSYTKP